MDKWKSENVENVKQSSPLKEHNERLVDLNFIYLH